MKKLIIIVSTIFLSFLFSSCKKDTIWVFYDETGCSDKWGVANVMDDKKTKDVKKYLKQKGIHIVTLEITNDGIAEGCFACHCKTGRRIKCEIYETDLQKAVNENFYQL
jgi:transposase